MRFSEAALLDAVRVASAPAKRNSRCYATARRIASLLGVAAGEVAALFEPLVRRDLVYITGTKRRCAFEHYMLTDRHMENEARTSS